MLEGAWVQKDEAMKALHKVLRYKFSLGQNYRQVLCTNHGHMLEGGWVQKDEAMKALHKVLRYNFSLGQTTASTLHEPRGSRA